MHAVCNIHGGMGSIATYACFSMGRAAGAVVKGSTSVGEATPHKLWFHASCQQSSHDMPLALVQSASLVALSHHAHVPIVAPHMCEQAAATDASPTCGWYMVGSYQVPDSQGFTCTCDFNQIWDTTLGIGQQQRT